MKYKIKANPNKIILEILWYKMKTSFTMLPIFTFRLYLQNLDHKNKIFLIKAAFVCWNVNILIMR